ncbi:hypothetical protein H2201_005845 [Coniosporium apollinis]|uniref:Wings apart-like protein C-terminal domain-containing protein n=1 Tax=Coniosporium apollinis TaxID=61459 RepID=A0ABQ9NNS0_9PEZI|nr:hypothetical protein H2201_005845 [Coniosporium apollinis]
MSSSNAIQRRRRPATYGKAARSSFYDLHNETAPTTQPSASETASRLINPQRSAQHSITGPTAKKDIPAKKPSQLAGLTDFDVPSSDEDNSAPSSRRPQRASVNKSIKPQRKAAVAKTMAAVITRRTPPATEAANLEVFDVPVSDDESTPPKRTRGNISRSPMARTKSDVKVRTVTAPEPAQQESPASDGGSKKRKRVGENTPQSHTKEDQKTAATVTTSVGGAEGPNTQGRRTLRSAGNTRQATPASAENAVPTHSALPVRDAPAARRPTRSRTKTAPVAPRMGEEQSAPAVLHKMFAAHSSRSENAARSSSPLSLPPSTPPKIAVEAEELLFSTPPARSSGRPAELARSGSVTPRQKSAWDKLLVGAGVLSSSPIDSMTNNLQTSGSGTKKQRTLSRSVSDLPQTDHTRRQRLIDSLIPAAAMSEESFEDGESEILEGASFGGPSVTISQPIESVSRLGEASQDVMDVDSQATASTSQRTTLADVGPRRTYACERTYLEDKNAEDDLLLALPLDSPITAKQPTGNGAFGMPQRQPQFMDDEQEDSQGGIKSIHELRAAGGNKRFLDDIESLLDDIEANGPSTVSRRRSGMVELCIKLADENFARKLFNTSLEQRLFPAPPIESDTILKFIKAVAIAFIVHAHAPVTWVRQIHRSGALDTLTSLLDLDIDISRIAKDRKTNMSKVAQSTLLEFRTLVQQAAFWGDEKPFILTPRLMALRSMDLLIGRLRKLGDDDILLTSDLTSQLLDIATSASGSLAQDVIPPYDVACLELSLSILESGSTLPGHAPARSPFSADHLTQLAAILPLLLTHPDANLAHSTSLAIRLATNLANNNPRICGQFAEPGLIHPLVGAITRTFETLDAEEHGDDEVKHLATIDRLVLLLGCGINLFEHSEACRVALLSTASPSFTGAEDGAAAGTGSIAPTPLTPLTHLFLSHRTRAWHAALSVQASHSNIPYGYLAVLLGNLCQTPELRAEVEAGLSAQGGMQVLVGAIEEFVRFHEAVDKEGGEVAEETWGVFTGRMRGVVERLRR